MEGEQLVVEGGISEFNLQVCDNQEDSLFFEVSVCQAVGAEQFCSAHFEGDGIDAVVYDGALVSFGIAGANIYDVRLYCCSRKMHFNIKYQIYQRINPPKADVEPLRGPVVSRFRENDITGMRIAGNGGGCKGRWWKIVVGRGAWGNILADWGV